MSDSGAIDVADVYTEDAILCGYDIVRGHDAIAGLLGSIIGQGWTSIEIEVAETYATADGVLLACRYAAKSADAETTAKSSYALVATDGLWKVAMHTAA